MKKLLLLLAIALIPNLATAATAVNRYVNTDCSNNGDGTASTCAGSVGGAGAYTTLANALTDVASDYADFTTSDVQVTVHCKGAAADTSEPDITGIVTDSTRYLDIVADAADRHDGKWNTSKYRIVNGNYFAALRHHGVKFFRVRWLQIEQNRTGSGGGTSAAGVDTRGSAITSGFWLFEGNIIRYTGDYVNVTAYGYQDDFNDSGVTKVWRNNLIYDFNRGGYFRTGNDGTYYLYNNTCYSNASGGDICFVIRDYGSGTITYSAKNNLANGSLVGFDIAGNGVYTHSNNLSEDTTSPDNTYDSLAVTFVNEASRDFHLDVSDSAAKDSGVDLSAATQGMTDDIDGQTRSGTWDIGADEYQSAGSAVPAVVSISH